MQSKCYVLVGKGGLVRLCTQRAVWHCQRLDAASLDQRNSIPDFNIYARPFRLHPQELSVTFGAIGFAGKCFRRCNRGSRDALAGDLARSPAILCFGAEIHQQ